MIATRSPCARPSDCAYAPNARDISSISAKLKSLPMNLYAGRLAYFVKLLFSNSTKDAYSFAFTCGATPSG